MEIAKTETEKKIFEVKDQRVYIMDKNLKTNELISFEFNRRPGDGEKFKIFYCKQLDKFFQL